MSYVENWWNLAEELCLKLNLDMVATRSNKHRYLSLTLKEEAFTRV